MRIDDNEISNLYRQEVAREGQHIGFSAMAVLHKRAIDQGRVSGAQAGRGGDIAPVAQGVIGGILQYLVEGGVPEADIRHIFDVSLRDLIPQIQLAVAAERAGAANLEGHA